MKYIVGVRFMELMRRQVIHYVVVSKIVTCWNVDLYIRSHV